MVNVTNQNVNVTIVDRPILATIPDQVIDIEISNRNGLNNGITPIWITFQSGTSFQFNLAQTSIENFRNILFFNQSGRSISVYWWFDTTYLYIESNINLLGHKMLIS